VSLVVVADTAVDRTDLERASAAV
ncbi:uncharacterized protein METZ01_LOCUS172398, partial [marine metagenome]